MTDTDEKKTPRKGERPKHGDDERPPTSAPAADAGDTPAAQAPPTTDATAADAGVQEEAEPAAVTPPAQDSPPLSEGDEAIGLVVSTMIGLVLGAEGANEQLWKCSPDEFCQMAGDVFDAVVVSGARFLEVFVPGWREQIVEGPQDGS